MPLIINGVEIENLIVVKSDTGEQVEIETLQDQLGNILFQKITETAPAWLNFTGIDANGNYEGMAAYDGNPVSYGLGKPTITNSSGTESVSWGMCNALNDDWFTEKYGDGYVRYVSGDNSVSSRMPKVVEDDLVIPDTYKGKPVTHLLTNCLSAFSTSSNSSGMNFSQAIYFKTITIGNNITTIQAYALINLQIKKITLPSSVRVIESNGVITEDWNETLSDFASTGGILEVNSNITSPSTGVFNYVITTKFSNNVTEVIDPVTAAVDKNGKSTTARKLVFQQSSSTPVTITYTSKPKTAFNLTVYSSNTSVNSYDWSTNANATVTRYSLSDYKE